MTVKIAQSKLQPIRIPAQTYNPATEESTLEETIVFQEFVTGYDADIQSVSLDTDGTLTLYPGFTWDFGSGPAFNNTPMIYASLFHDGISRITISGQVPWKVRKEGDKYFRMLLGKAGASPLRQFVTYSGVRFYSIFIARWWDRRKRSVPRL